jgi:hypothetical protein
MLTKTSLHHQLSGDRHSLNGLLYLTKMLVKYLLFLSQRDPRSSTKRQALSHILPLLSITPDKLRVNKSLLIGKKLKKYFSGFGGALGTVTEHLLDHDAYRLEYTDGHVDIISFNDILKLLPKSWSKPRDSSHEKLYSFKVS